MSDLKNKLFQTIQSKSWKKNHNKKDKEHSANRERKEEKIADDKS